MTTKSTKSTRSMNATPKFEAAAREACMSLIGRAEFEERVLWASQFLPACARKVRDCVPLSPEELDSYDEWLCEQITDDGDED